MAIRRPADSTSFPATAEPAQAGPLQSGLDKVQRMIDWGRLSYPIASANLGHWRDGKGKDRVLPVSAFATETFFLDHLRNAHKAKFVAGADRRRRAGEVGPGRSFAMEWTDSLYAPYLTDLYFALGGFTVHSKVVAELVARADRIAVRFTRWEVQIRDDYNWDPGKSTLIPGVGRVTDDEMRALEMAGYGRAYQIRSEWATITAAAVVGDELLAP